MRLLLNNFYFQCGNDGLNYISDVNPRVRVDELHDGPTATSTDREDKLFNKNFLITRTWMDFASQTFKIVSELGLIKLPGLRWKFSDGFLSKPAFEKCRHPSLPNPSLSTPAFRSMFYNLHTLPVVAS